jgi:hypothetical protein
MKTPPRSVDGFEPVVFSRRAPRWPAARNSAAHRMGQAAPANLWARRSPLRPLRRSPASPCRDHRQGNRQEDPRAPRPPRGRSHSPTARTRTRRGLGGHARRAAVGRATAAPTRGADLGEARAEPRVRDPAACRLLELTLVAPCDRGDEQPKRDAPTLCYLDEITNLFEDLTRIVDGMLCPPSSGARSLLTSQIRLDSLSASAARDVQLQAGPPAGWGLSLSMFSPVSSTMFPVRCQPSVGPPWYGNVGRENHTK